jgi:hypothetical protein
VVLYLILSQSLLDGSGGLDKKFHQAKSFYVVAGMSLLLGLLINYVGISPIKALLWSAIL